MAYITRGVRYIPPEALLGQRLGPPSDSLGTLLEPLIVSPLGPSWAIAFSSNLLLACSLSLLGEAPSRSGRGGLPTRLSAQGVSNMDLRPPPRDINSYHVPQYSLSFFSSGSRLHAGLGRLGVLLGERERERERERETENMQYGSKMHPRRPKIASRWPKTTQKARKRPPRRPKSPPRRPPGWPENAKIIDFL